jgi:hypothetical protein
MAHASDLKRLIIDEYLELHRELISKKYGSKNIVLIVFKVGFSLFKTCKKLVKKCLKLKEE